VESKRNTLLKARSAIRTSNKLFDRVSESVNKIYTKRLIWKDLLYALALVKLNDVSDFKLVSPLTSGKMKKMSMVDTHLFIDEICGKDVCTRIIFPINAPCGKMCEVLKFYLSMFRLDFPVMNGGIVVKIVLPFVPTEVKIESDGENGNGHRAFICPDEIEVS